jgi:CxxC-x17-CxxC domain-containing protein
MSDKTIICRECEQAFTFTAGEQAFYQERGYTEPQRCSSCRAARKAQRATGDNSSRSFNSGYSGGGYAAGPRQLYPAVCSECGQETEVPFPPRGDRPVYCRECFQTKRATAPRYGR